MIRCPFPEVGSFNDKIYVKLEKPLTVNKKKVNVLEKDSGKLVFMEDYDVVKKEKNPEDHWTGLASSIRNLIGQTSDERLQTLYQKLYSEGWSERKFPLSTRNAHIEIKHAVFQAVAIETIERREGRIPSIK